MDSDSNKSMKSNTLEPDLSNKKKRVFLAKSKSSRNDIFEGCEKLQNFNFRHRHSVLNQLPSCPRIRGITTREQRYRSDADLLFNKYKGP